MTISVPLTSRARKQAVAIQCVTRTARCAANVAYPSGRWSAGLAPNRTCGDHITSCCCSPIFAESSLSLKPVSTYSVRFGFSSGRTRTSGCHSSPDEAKIGRHRRLGDDQLVTPTPSRCFHNGQGPDDPLRGCRRIVRKPEAETPRPSPGRNLATSRLMQLAGGGPSAFFWPAPTSGPAPRGVHLSAVKATEMSDWPLNSQNSSGPLPG